MSLGILGRSGLSGGGPKCLGGTVVEIWKKYDFDVILFGNNWRQEGAREMVEVYRDSCGRGGSVDS